jgi:ubiquinone/menaquinone biosynthesis C-methylase UbiE
MTDAHREAILDQFTRQAVPFATAPSIRDEVALRTVVEFSQCGPDDTVLDVACGPGILACAFAQVARHVTGIDLTPAMLDRARALQVERGLKNVTWKQGDVLPLPYGDGAFTLVVSRFAFHHLLEPGAVLKEMRRVCAPRGTVMVIDSAPAPEKAAAFNRVEVLRDPSHVRALPLDEHLALFAAADLPVPRQTFYRLQTDLEGLLARSFPNPGDGERMRAIYEASLADDALDMATRQDGDVLRLAFPVAVLAARR